MAQKSIFSIVNFESAPQRTVARADLAHPRPAPKRPSPRPARAAAPKTPRSYTLAGFAYERTLLLLVAASFAAFIGAYLLGTALEIVGALAVPALAVAAVGFAVSKFAAARRTAQGGLTGYAAVIDPAHRLERGR